MAARSRSKGGVAASRRNLMPQSSLSANGPCCDRKVGQLQGIAAPSSFLTRIESQLFRVLLLRRLRLPLPLSSRSCRCRLSEHVRAGGGGFPVESAAARICREAGGRVATNRIVRDLDIGEPVNDGRREGPSTPWTRSCQCCTVMGHDTEAQVMRMRSLLAARLRAQCHIGGVIGLSSNIWRNLGPKRNPSSSGRGRNTDGT